MEESCNFKFCKICSSTVKQKNKSNTQLHLLKSKHSDSNKTILKSIAKDETSHNIVKRIKIKNTPIGDITKFIKKKKIRCPKFLILNLPKIILEPKTRNIHKCNYSCVNWTNYNLNKTASMCMLAIPLYFGFKRHITNVNGVQKSVTYETPCGVHIQNIEDMMRYLMITKSKMTIDQFDFDSDIDPLAKFRFLKPIMFLDDISEGLEFKSISCVNGINGEQSPKLNYITNRQAITDVNLNLDTDFLCGCDCSDNCQDKSKCACWQLTIEAQSSIPNSDKNEHLGYEYRRLYTAIPTGIFECNKTCKCNRLCLNRVVQQSLCLDLQLFKTKKKGWGVRCLNDIPRGTFICCYIGNILNETNVDEQGINYGDEYLLDLDFIDKFKDHKEDYEEYAFPSCLNNTIYDENSASGNALQWLGNLKLKNFKDSICNYYNGNSEYTIDSKYSGNIGRFFNHSCNPNLFVQSVFVDTHDLRFPWISFFSQCVIKAGTELTWDYAYEVGSLPGKKVACYCESVECKQRLL
ncbi:hypothetical protein AGLY_012028 [Aphis glycines]|uniref:SET domain-containing protein n=1 Tax=Aphis glycines TaxID=307491 RepID=A0A6G0TCH0_APHGL|nr:hypothetical protein AGLY_012028 [Aphis glycines]